MKKNWVLWTSAFLITVFAAYYQRITGPSYPYKTKILINNTSYALKLPRSSDGLRFAEISFDIPDTSVKAYLHYRNYLSDREFTRNGFERTGSKLVFNFPHLIAGGKIEYFVELKYGNKSEFIRNVSPVTLRYRDYVPLSIMIPHILLMFLGMLFSNITGLIVISGKGSLKKYSLITLAIFFIGGIILGCIVQKFAFGEFWTGVPFGWDLTDNKTLIAILAWVIAILFNLRKERKYLFLISSLITILVFCIPHSMYGTERIIH